MTWALQQAVQTLCEKGHLDRALDVLGRMDTVPSTITYLSLLKACSKSKTLTHARKVHSHLAQHAPPLTAPLGNYLVLTLAKCGAIHDALHTSHTLPYRSVFSWTAIISAFADSGHGQEALRVHQCMLDDGVEPDQYTFVSLFKACGSIPDLAQGKKLHADARQKGFASDVFVGSTLISMYGKCGAISEAEHVFDALSECDVVAWNAMLSAYVEQGQGQKALQFYTLMQEDGVSPNQRTYVSVLQACATVAEKEVAALVQEQSSELIPLEIGQALHADAHMKGFTSDVFVGNSLLSMYGKCGAIVEAEYVFGTLSKRNGVSWNAMLSAYVVQGQGQKALRLYTEIEEEGVSPDQLTFVSAIQACATLAEKEGGLLVGAQSTKVISLKIGQALHADARRKGFASYPIVCNTLVSMYGKCGAIVEAEHVFGELLHGDVVSWNAILSAYVEQSQGKKALQLYTQMQSEGVSPDQWTYVLVLQACATLAEKEETLFVDGRTTKLTPIEIGYALHANAHRKGFTFDAFVGSTLVNMYGRWGAIVEAEHVFSAVSQHTVVLWNAMISAYVVQGQGHKALQLYTQMQEEGVSSDQLTFVMAIQACATLVEKEEAPHLEQRQTEVTPLEIGRALHADARCKGFSFDVFVGSTLMGMYGKCGAIVEVEHVFGAIFNQDVVSWNAMLSAYVEGGQGWKALQLYTQMIKEGMIPDQRTSVITLWACASLAERDDALLLEGRSTKVLPLGIGHALHAHVCREGLASDAIIGSTLVSMYAKCGALMEAELVFYKLSQRTVVTWTTMLSAYVGQGQGEKAVQLYRQMQNHCATPNHITIICILQACIALGSLEICEQLHFNIVSAGYDQILSVSATLLHAYGSCASMVDGQALFDKLLEPDIVSWNACIAGHAGDGNFVASLHMVEQLKFAGIKPDELTFTSVLAACSHSGLVVKGHEYFESMSRDYGIPQDLKHYGSMLDLFGRAGDFKRVKKMLGMMPMEADLDTSLSLLGSCRAHGNLEMAKHTFDSAVSLQPKQATAYILMSNIYADAGLQERAVEVENYTWMDGKS